MSMATSGQGKSRTTLWRQKKGYRARTVHLPPESWEEIDRVLKIHGLSLSAWVERAAERFLIERIPDAPYARHIPYDYRDPEQLKKLLAYTVALLGAAAEARKQEVQRVERQHRGDWSRISQAREDANLAWDALAWVHSIDADQALRDYTYRPNGGRPVRDRSKPHQDASSEAST